LPAEPRCADDQRAHGRLSPTRRHGAKLLALQGIDELLDTYDLVRAHYNANLVLAGVVVNRWERTVEHRNSTAEIERYFGAHVPWQPYLPKRTALQDAGRRGVPVTTSLGVPVHHLAGRPSPTTSLGVPVHHLAGAVARELADAFAQLATRMEPVRAVG
jgi:hypothetical protein